MGLESESIAETLQGFFIKAVVIGILVFLVGVGMRVIAVNILHVEELVTAYGPEPTDPVSMGGMLFINVGMLTVVLGLFAYTCIRIIGEI